MTNPLELLQDQWTDQAEELRRLAKAMGIDAARADDVVQDAYVAALTRPPKVSDPDDLRRWLYRVTVNLCHLEHRKRARWRRAMTAVLPMSRSPVATSNPSEMAADAEERRLVRQALEEMDFLHRCVLVLRYFADLTSKDIGEILDMPGATVRSHLRVARRQLADRLKGVEHHDE